MCHYLIYHEGAGPGGWCDLDIDTCDGPLIHPLHYHGGGVSGTPADVASRSANEL